MYTSPQMIIHWKQRVLILLCFIVINISPHYEMISKAEPCLVVSIQYQLTLCIGTVIVRQIPATVLYIYCEFQYHYEFFV